MMSYAGSINEINYCCTRLVAFAVNADADLTSSVMAISKVGVGTAAAAAAAGAAEAGAAAAAAPAPLVLWRNGEQALKNSLPSVLSRTRACRPSCVVATRVIPGGMLRLRSRYPAAQSVCSPMTQSFRVV